MPHQNAFGVLRDAAVTASAEAEARGVQKQFIDWVLTGRWLRQGRAMNLTLLFGWCLFSLLGRSASYLWLRCNSLTVGALQRQ